MALEHVSRAATQNQSPASTPIWAKIEYCEKCDYPKAKCQCERIRQEKMEAAQRRERDMIARLGGVRAYREFTLECFGDGQAVAKCADYPKANLYICGPTGCGKTHLATAIIRKCYPDCMVVKPMEILRRMRACETAREEGDMLERYAGANLLIDDLGVEKMTEYALQTIYEIIDKRWMAGGGGYHSAVPQALPSCGGGLIITSNLELDGLSHKLGDDRIVSRIAGMCRVITLKGKDWRLDGGKV